METPLSDEILCPDLGDTDVATAINTLLKTWDTIHRRPEHADCPAPGSMSPDRHHDDPAANTARLEVCSRIDWWLEHADCPAPDRHHDDPAANTARLEACSRNNQRLKQAECPMAPGAVPLNHHDPAPPGSSTGGRPWSHWYALLREYASTHNKSPPQRFVTSCGAKLGRWVSNQRQAHDGMPRARAKALEATPGWRWLAVKPWSQWYALLREYASKHNKSPPPQFVTTCGEKLGRWVVNQRRARDVMSPRRAEALEATPGWHWSAEDVWDQMYAHLQAYVARHAQLPNMRCNHDGVRLGRWVSQQRRAFKRKRGELTPKREAALSAIPGWRWYGFEAAWDQTYALLDKYLATKKRMPERGEAPYRGRNLSNWISRQRRDKRFDELPPEYVQALEALPGWRW